MKDTHNLRFKFREFHSHDETARMEDEIEASGQLANVAAETVAHAPLDAVALMRFADYLTDGKADAGTGGQWSSSPGGRLPGEKPAHGSGLPLAAGSIGALIVGVPLQTRAC
jgi:hypothetical protein